MDRKRGGRELGANSSLIQVASWRQQDLLEPGVFGLGLLQNGKVGVGIFPKSEEILVRRLGLDLVAR